MKIDFVVPWVDGSDPAWRKEKYQYMGTEEPDAGDERYRDMGILKYWFRAVETYAPWVNQVHFITWGHLPEWINTECPKLRIVNHKDYIPEEYLPTFSSHTIGLNVHRIPGLSEHFVYFNDDLLLNAPITPAFFFKSGLPCDFAHINNIYVSNPVDVYEHVRVNCTWVTSNHHSYIKSFLHSPFRYVNFHYPLKNIVKNILKLENASVFQGFENHHLTNAYLKATFEETWEQSAVILHHTCCNRFRTPLDVNQSVFRYKQLAQGKFYPVSKRSRGKYVSMGNAISSITEDILNSTHKVLCINDVPNLPNYEEIAAAVIKAYEQKLPNKSSFEK